MQQRSNGSFRHRGLVASMRSLATLGAYLLLVGCPGPDPTTGTEGDGGPDSATILKPDAGMSNSSRGHLHDAGRRDVVSSDATHPTDSGTGHHDTGLEDAVADDAHDAVADDAYDAVADDASSSPLGVSPTMLEFTSPGSPTGFVACGSSPGTHTFTVANEGTGTVMWWPVFGRGVATPYQLSTPASTCTATAPCLVTAGVPITVTVAGPAVPANDGIQTFDDTLTVFSSAPGDPGTVIQLVESSYGAILTFDPTDVPFGSEVDVGSYTQTVKVINSGNAPTSAMIGLTSASSVEFGVSPASVDVPPMMPASFTATFTPSDLTASATGAVTLASEGPLCGPLPPNLSVEGQGTLPIAVTPSLNFNANQNGGVGVSCGATGPTLKVAVTNNGATTAKVNMLALGLGTLSPYDISAATALLPIVVDPGVTVNFPVTPKQIPSSDAPALLLNDTVTVTTDAIGDMPHVVSLTETSAGAVLTLVPAPSSSPASVVFSTIPVGMTATYPMQLENSGNVAASVTMSTKMPFAIDANVMAPAGGTASLTASFGPPPLGTTGNSNVYNGTGAMTVTNTPLCGSSSSQPTPVTFGLMATIVSNGLVYGASPPTLSFGNLTCGVTPNAGATVTLTNSSGQPTTFSATLSGAGASLFALSTSGGTLPAATGGTGTATFTVTPLTLGPSNVMAVEAQFGINATVTVVIGGSSGETFVIPITEQPEGAYPMWSAPFVNVAVNGGTASFALRNLSPTPADFTLGLTSPPGFSLVAPAGNPPSGIASLGSSLAATILDSNTTRTPTFVTGVATSPMTPLCATLPNLRINPN